MKPEDFKKEQDILVEQELNDDQLNQATGGSLKEFPNEEEKPID